MKYLLDTCIISEMQKNRPSKAVCDWLAARDEEDLYLSVLTLGEIQKGISRLSDGRKKAGLQSWLDRDLPDRFQSRIVEINCAAALVWGQVTGESQRHGKPIPVIDALIGATAIVIGATVITRNDSDVMLTGAKTFNPWNNR